ncbi:MAG: tripartite tricarboxylate transporter permease [Chloroflexi bacterium]|nr:tripartite tricarboxylate transporter permease [Chloroflexota bacterium]
MEAWLQALQNYTDLAFVGWVLAGGIGGLIFGIIPGISGMTLVVLFLPFVLDMKPEYALGFITATAGASMTGGSVTAILLNVPGTTVNAATLLDGYPMTKKGQAGRALGAAVTASALGGILAVFLAFAMVPLILPMVMAMRSADMVFLILMGLTFIGVLGTGAMIKGLISGGVGLLISFIGYQSITGMQRFTFGSTYLYDGLPIMPVILGLFALPEVIDLAAKGGTIAQTRAVIKGMTQVIEGAKDVFRHWGLWFRSTVIGYIIGVIPGIGAATSIWVAYGQAKQISKHPEKFGTGTVEGVIAPESSNNATQAGALLTTVALGIPGSAEHAVVLGAFLILGVTAGPTLMMQHLDLPLTLFFAIIAGNLIGGILCFWTAQHLAKIGNVPSRILVPLVTVMVLAGAFVMREQFNDVIVTLIFGALGFGMRRLGFNAPALLVGYVLGSLFEQYWFIAIQVSGPTFFMRPISLGIIAVTVLVLTSGPIRSLVQQLFKKGAKGT